MAIRSKSAVCAHEHHPTSSGLPNQNPQQSSHTKGRRSVRTQFRRSKLRSMVLCATAAASLVGSTGCTMLSGLSKNLQRSHAVDDFMIAHRNKVLATKAWFREKDCHCNERFLNEFKAGFLAGYADVADGSDGCTPAVAPSEYWGWRYQSADGQAAVNAWFAGFPLGVKAAEQDGVGHWGRIAPMGVRTAATGTNYAAPLPAGASYVVDADGNPIYTEAMPLGTPTEQMIPGAMELDPLDLDSPGDLQSPPDPSDTAPSPADEALMDRSDLEPEKFGDAATAVTSLSAQYDSQEVVANLSDADNLIPKAEAGEADEASYSLNDLGDEAIEGIFGSLDAPNNLGVVSADSVASQGSVEFSSSATDASDQGDGTVETASADGDIPFKFE